MLHVTSYMNNKIKITSYTYNFKKNLIGSKNVLQTGLRIQ